MQNHVIIIKIKEKRGYLGDGTAKEKEMKENDKVTGFRGWMLWIHFIGVFLIWGVTLLTSGTDKIIFILLGAVAALLIGIGSWYLLKQQQIKQEEIRQKEKVQTAEQVQKNTLEPVKKSLEKTEHALVETTEQLIEYISDNAVTTKSLSSGIDDTNQAIEAVSQELNTISVIVGNIEEKVYSGTEVSDTLIQRANDMNSYVKNNLSRGMETMELTKNDIETALQGLATMERVNEMADEILRITKQTNLLSLNASIESARAGEAGKGFAIVADEIAQLAKETKSTATNIQNIIANSNESIAFVRKCFDGVMKYLEEEVTISFRTFAEQSELYGAGVTNIKESINDIQDHIAELSDSIKEILDNVEEVNEASADNAKGVSDLTERNKHTMQVTKEIQKLLKS